MKNIQSQKRTFVISGFPGVGKSYCAKVKQDKYKILDSDSSNYSWIKDENGNNTKERNPDFPNNYIEHIKANIGKVDVICVSSHETVRKALNDNNIKVIYVYPDRFLKKVWIERLINRNSPESMINFISDNWYDLIDGMHREEFRCLKIVLKGHNSYLDINRIKNLFDDYLMCDFLN